MVDINGIAIGNAEQLGAVNINGRLYATPDAISEVYRRVGGSQFNGVNQQTGEMQQEDMGQVDNTVADETQEAIDAYSANIDKLTRDYYELANNPPKDSAELIGKMLENLKGWKGAYDTQLTSLIGQTLASEFEYKAEEDALLQDATKYANRQMMEALNARGILNGTQTADEMTRIYKELLPQYQNQAYQRYNDGLNNKFKQIEVLNKLNEQDYDKYYQYMTNSISLIDKIDTKTYNSFKDTLSTIHTALTDQINARKDIITQRKNDVELGYKMLEQTGYVNNEISQLTGLRVGTLSSKARESLQKRYFELQDAAQEFQNDLTKKNIDHQNKLKELEITKADKQKAEQQKAKAGDVLAKLSGLSGTEAMSEIQKNIGLLSDVLGDQLMDVVKVVRTQVDKDESEAMANKRLSLSISAQDRATAAADRAASASETRQIKADADTYDDVIKREYAYGYVTGEDGKPVMKDGNPVKSTILNKTAIIGYLRELKNEGVQKEVIDDLSKRWGITKDDSTAYYVSDSMKSSASFGVPFGYSGY
jgi:hypothetical protein